MNKKLDQYINGFMSVFNFSGNSRKIEPIEPILGNCKSMESIIEDFLTIIATSNESSLDNVNMENNNDK